MFFIIFKDSMCKQIRKINVHLLWVHGTKENLICFEASSELCFWPYKDEISRGSRSEKLTFILTFICSPLRLEVTVSRTLFLTGNKAYLISVKLNSKKLGQMERTLWDIHLLPGFHMPLSFLIIHPGDNKISIIRCNFIMQWEKLCKNKIWSPPFRRCS